MSMPGPGGSHPFFWHRHYHHMSRRGRFGPRLLWFGLGAGAYAWYSHCKETRHAYVHHQAAHGDEWRNWTAHRWGGPPRDRLEQARQPMPEQQATQMPQPPVLHQQDPTQQWAHGRGWGPRARVQSQSEDHTAYPMPPVMAAAPSIMSEPQMQPFAPSLQEQPFNWHADRIREAGKATTESMSDMSEQALDSLITSIQGLKERIAASRKEREGRSPQSKPSEPEGKKLV